MGANAQTSVPTFTAGDVLTAANMNISARTGVPVFASTTTRDAAFGGAGEKTLAEGQLCYVENLTGVAQLQYYDGAAWVSLSSPGLVSVVSETSFSASSAVNVDNCFTSTYTDYLLHLRITSASDQIAFRLRVGGSNSATAYYGVNLDMYSSNAGATGTAVASNATSAIIGGATTRSQTLIFSPQLAEITHFSSQGSRWESTTPRTETTQTNYKYVHNAATAYDGFGIFPLSGTMTGTYAVYGFTK